MFPLYNIGHSLYHLFFQYHFQYHYLAHKNQFLQDGIPLVNMSTLELYISSKGEYIIRHYNQEIGTMARISEKAGRFLNTPEDLVVLRIFLFLYCCQ